MVSHANVFSIKETLLQMQDNFSKSKSSYSSGESQRPSQGSGKTTQQLLDDELKNFKTSFN